MPYKRIECKQWEKVMANGAGIHFVVDPRRRLFSASRSSVVWDAKEDTQWGDASIKCKGPRVSKGGSDT